MNNLVATEPVAVGGAIGLVLTSGVALVALFFPDRLTPPVQAAIILFGNAVIALGVVLFQRGKVTPA